MKIKNTAIQVKITGRVQGVAFRYYAQREAEKHNITGWIKNINDGSIELWAEGSEESISKFHSWLQKGPPYARIDAVQSTTEIPLNKYTNFSITG